jgi:hypothetical protein
VVQVMKMKRVPTVVVILLLCLLSASVGFMLSPLADYQGLQGNSVYPPEAGADYYRSGPATPGKGAAESPAGASDTDTERKIIQRAALSIEVEDFTTSEEALIRAVERSNGFISDSYAYVTESGRQRGEMTIRVPEDSFLALVAELELLGRVQTKHLSGEDVTEEYIDLQARLNNSRRQEQRLLEILELAGTVEEVLEVERELERVRGEIEQMTGRLTYLDNRIELATITVSLGEPEPITQSWGIRDALRAAFAGFVGVIRGMIIAIGYLVPIIILLGLGWLITAKVVRRQKGRGE